MIQNLPICQMERNQIFIEDQNFKETLRKMNNQKFLDFSVDVFVYDLLLFI